MSVRTLIRHRTTRAFGRALAALLPAVAVCAQDLPIVPQDPPLAIETTYREGRSLALFAACDRDHDDRLDVFEFGAAFVDLENPRDPIVFRRTDTDASGFVEWSEFDVRMRSLIDRLGRARVQPATVPVDVRDPTVSPPPADPTEQIIGQFDVDRDGVMSRDEFAQFVRRADLESKIVERFAQLDADGNGTLNVGEFSRVLMFAPSVWQRIAPHEQDIRSMPDQFRAIDFNLDGAIDASELEVGLRRIHPSLAKWTQRVLFDADRTHDRTLGWSELAAATDAARRRLEKK